MTRLAAILGPARDHPCVRCGRPAESWHHRLPRSRGGPHDHYNCVPVCGHGTRGCHGWIEHNPADARAVGLAVPGRFLRGVYAGADAWYRSRYNNEGWDPNANDWRTFATDRET